MYEHSRKLHAHACNGVIEAGGEATYGVHIRRSDPPCIQRRNKECLLFNATLVLRCFTPDFNDKDMQIYRFLHKVFVVFHLQLFLYMMVK